nr:hypothetical protein 2 [bacterium]
MIQPGTMPGRNCRGGWRAPRDAVSKAMESAPHGAGPDWRWGLTWAARVKAWSPHGAELRG